jgi:hypothetical protein
VQGRYPEIRGRGAEVLVISFAPPERLASYREEHGWPFPIVADPGREAYRAFGLDRAGWGDLLRPRVLLRYAGLILWGYRIRGSGEDVHQLGGDFVLDRERRLIYAHRSTHPADRPPAEALIRALGRPSPAGGTS